MHPSLLLQLRHARVDPGKTSATLFPRRQSLLVPRPRDLSADAVTLHLVKVGRAGRRQVIKLAPQQLPLQTLRRFTVFSLELRPIQHRLELVVEGSRGYAPELHVRRERGGGGCHERRRIRRQLFRRLERIRRPCLRSDGTPQRGGRRLRLLELAHVRRASEGGAQTSQTFRLAASRWEALARLERRVSQRLEGGDPVAGDDIAQRVHELGGVAGKGGNGLRRVRGGRRGRAERGGDLEKAGVRGGGLTAGALREESLYVVEGV